MNGHKNDVGEAGSLAGDMPDVADDLGEPEGGEREDHERGGEEHKVEQQHPGDEREFYGECGHAVVPSLQALARHDSGECGGSVADYNS